MSLPPEEVRDEMRDQSACRCLTEGSYSAGTESDLIVIHLASLIGAGCAVGETYNHQPGSHKADVMVGKVRHVRHVRWVLSHSADLIYILTF